jgi:hypothetical protein
VNKGAYSNEEMCRKHVKNAKGILDRREFTDYDREREAVLFRLSLSPD